MKGALGGLMRQAQQMQDNMKRMQEELAAAEVTGESGAGMVKVTLSGKHQARSVQVDPSVLSEDREFLEDLIAAAINDAVRKVEALNQDKMGQAAAGLNLPPGFKLPE